jgi:hypothetical protein
MPHTASDDSKRRRLLSWPRLAKALSAGASASRSTYWLLECGEGRGAIDWTSRECARVCIGSVGACAEHDDSLLKEAGVEAA